MYSGLLVSLTYLCPVSLKNQEDPIIQRMLELDSAY